jgi:hypothetical protein
MLIVCDSLSYMELPNFRFVNASSRLPMLTYAENSAISTRSYFSSNCHIILGCFLFFISYVSKPLYRARLEESDFHSFILLTADAGD